MDIVNFFEKVEGTWFSQRTIHQISTQQSQTGQTTLEITRLPADAAPVTTLCQKLAADSAQVVAALQTLPEGGDAAVLVALKGDSDSDGLFLSQAADGSLGQGQYRLEDEVLTLVSEGARAAIGRAPLVPQSQPADAYLHCESARWHSVGLILFRNSPGCHPSCLLIHGHESLLPEKLLPFVGEHQLGKLSSHWR
jgi:hypothetical protein